MTKQRIAILGSTGSVGVSTLEVIAQHPEKFQVAAVTAQTNVRLLLEQCIAFAPQVAVMEDEAAANALQLQLAEKGLNQIQVRAGAEALAAVSRADDVDSVMSAIVGSAGLLPTLAAVVAGKRVLIANKEPLVMTGGMFMREAEKSGATILPIDSEHNAVYQCLPADKTAAGVAKIHLTASGGPFRGQKWQSLQQISPDQACAHPNWSMGRKISVDSATMMNKGLELIEASALFKIAAAQVEVIIHPQSIVHSLVEYCDGSFLAQLGAPDMKIPIAYALGWPQRIQSGAATLSLTEIAQLDFQRPDMANLPCLALAREAATAGGSCPAVLNAANEVAVDAFLERRIRFTDIPQVIDHSLQKIGNPAFASIAELLNIDHEARAIASAKLDSFPGQ